jgi:hypothetical protein
MGSYGNLKVWNLPEGIANIFSMHELEKLYCITYDSWMGHYVVHTPKGVVNFYKDEQGLPYIDLDGPGEEATIMLLQRVQGKRSKAAGELIKTALVQTVQGNYEGYTKKDILKTNKAHRAQGMIGNPSEKDYKGMVSGNLITNCPITTTNISNTRAMFGPDLASIRGKTVQRTLAPMVADYVAVPHSLVETNKVITMAADVFFVNGTAFLLTISQQIKFITAEHVPVRTAKSLAKHLDQVLKVIEEQALM